MTIRRINLHALEEVLQRNGTILVPNQRLRDTLLAELLSEHAVIATPPVYAVDIWIKQCWERLALDAVEPCCQYRLLSATEELFIWQQIIEESLSQLPLLNPDQTAELVSRSYREMRQWIPDEAARAALAACGGIADVAMFERWCARFHKVCEQQRRISLVECTARLSKLFAGQPELIAEGDITRVNFYRPPPLYQALFQTFPDTSSLFTTAPESDAGEATLCSDRIRFEYGDPESEVRACAEWARDLLADDPECHVGIIANLDEQRLARCRALIGQVLQPRSLLFQTDEATGFNHGSSSGSLLDHALVHDAFLLLNLANEQQLSEDVSRLLRSPFLLAAETEQEARLQMELYMRRYFTDRCTVQDLLYFLNREDRAYHCPQLAAALLAFRTRLRSQPGSQSASAWADCFAALLGGLGWPGQDERSGLLQHWREALRQFSESGPLLAPMTLNTALARLRQGCSRLRPQQPFLPAAQVSFYSLSECQGMEFDHAWLLGFDDRTLPAAASPSPFIPYSLQREWQLPACHSDIQYQTAQQDFTLLCRSVRQSLVASHHLRRDDLLLRPSSFIQDIPLGDAVPPCSDLNDYVARHPGTATPEPWLDAAALPLLPDEQVRGGQAVISNQSACPFRAFAMHRLMVNPMEDFASGLDAVARGRAMHTALELLFQEIESRQQLSDLSADARREACLLAAEQGVASLQRYYRNLMTPRFREIERERLAGLLLRFLELESTRGEFRVLEQEAERRWQYQGLALELKIDRIDRLADGSLAVLDYKTGKYPVSRQSLLEQRPENMQLPLYYTVTSGSESAPVSVLGIAHVNVEKIGYSGLGNNPDFHDSLYLVENDSEGEDWERLTRSWQERVNSLAREFVDGINTVTPVHGLHTCRYCGLQSLCRIQESLGTDADLVESEDEEEQQQW